MENNFLPEQLNPSPEKPVLQAQINEPMVLTHLALTSQTGTEALHSSASKQEVEKNHKITITERAHWASHVNLLLILLKIKRKEGRISPGTMFVSVEF